MKKCPNCGLETEDGQVFCHHCGARMEDVGRTDADTERLNRELRQKDKLIAELKERLEQAERRNTVPPKKKRWAAISMVLLAICICSVIFAAYQGSEASYYEHSYNSLSSRYSALKEECETLEEQTEFMDKYIGIIDLNSEEYLYHTYDCPIWDWSGEWNILAYNVASAESRDYEPCPECH